jgi:polyisoprenoid-binding protein YceI
MKKRVLLSAVALLVALTTTFAQKLDINTASSSIQWKGKKVTGEHYGNISLKSGSLTLTAGKISGGEFVVDMTSISVVDLPAGEWNDNLVGHLKSDDFFGVATYPESKLVITSATTDAIGNVAVKGVLTIKGINQLAEFTAVPTDNGYSALITVDRTKYDIKYGSGKFFDSLGDKTIADEFTLDIKIATK